MKPKELEFDTAIALMPSFVQRLLNSNTPFKSILINVLKKKGLPHSIPYS